MTDRDRLIELIKKATTEVTFRTSGGRPVTKFQRSIVDKAEAKDLADYLLANGVFLLPEDLRGTQDFSISAFIEAMQMYKEKDRYIKTPCKVGTKVYDIALGKIYEWDIASYIIDGEGLSFVTIAYMKGNNLYSNTYRIADIGKKLFLTKEEAEEKLKELGQ